MSNYHDKFMKYKKSYKLLKNEISEILKNNKINMKGGGLDDKEWFYDSLKKKDSKDDKILDENKDKFITTINNLKVSFGLDVVDEEDE